MISETEKANQCLTKLSSEDGEWERDAIEDSESWRNINCLLADDD